MAYTKTTWQNNVTDIDETNLNKMEQGIYDNSLVVDAIKDKLNPTDTETYKTAELTEGQITDVIGVSDIVIKGQTSQDGEPTPDSPVDVNVVSGSNVINIYNNQILGKELPLDLPVENLFDKNNYVAGQAYSNSTITPNTPWGIFYLSCNGGETYVISGLKTYSNTQIVQCNSNKQFILNLVTRSAENTEYTITATQNGYIGISFVWSASASKGSEVDTINIKKAGTDPIELCKIGNYQDYFYKSGSKWYLHKEIEKLILDGTENFNNTYTAFGLEGIKKSIAAGGGLCNYYLYNNRNSGMVNLPNNYFAIQTVSGGSTSSVYFQNTAFTTVTDFKADLAQKYENGKPVTLYYPSGTATNTEITDTTLISQLNAIINSPLYEDTNITQTNSDLPIILDITAYKDNINGIKAWIRK